ncbi:Transposon Ty3-G Gag-Pol polyprotein [Stylophora pistillata]|uniref:Transposon Ty3-G Gag-Pol polyprotein n=1 Tax=Stylophora pistillata TaxID=50429 RepID=A0A2B4RFI4_STYPI|nr:Transposon Ty3-G Gag-Pol polyprotein [Stylophora pistillata]
MRCVLVLVVRKQELVILPIKKTIVAPVIPELVLVLEVITMTQTRVVTKQRIIQITGTEISELWDVVWCSKLLKDTWWRSIEKCSSCQFRDVVGREAGNGLQNYGAELAVIKSVNENNIILNLVTNQPKVQALGVWIGLSRDVFRDYAFYWVDNTPLGIYSAWAGSQPSSIREECVHTFTEGQENGKWNDNYCSLSGREPPYKYPLILCQKVEAELSWDAVEEIKKLFPIDNDQLTEDQKLSVWKILAKHSKAVSRGPHDIGHCTKAQLRINTGSAPPSRLPLRRFLPEQEKYINEETQRLLEGDVIEPSTSPWSAQVVLAKNGSYRYCVDFRRLNSCTVKEHYLIPKVEDMIDSLAGAKFFSTLDFISAYHEFEIHPDDREKTPFSTKKGHWQLKQVPFGLCNAAPFFVRQIARLLTGMTWEELLAFFDDVLLFNPTFAKHCESLDRALSLIEEAELKVKPEKCRILPKRVPFVGHILSKQGVSADSEKPPPTTVSELRVFLGKAGYYRKFIPDFATLAHPLFQLEEKGRQFMWSIACCQKSFDSLKQALCVAPVLAFPQFDLPFVLDTDSSTTGVAAVLSQVQDGEERPVAYATKTLTKSQRKWPPTKLEMYALVFGTESFYPCLINKQFVARLDRQSLVWLQSFKHPKPQKARWVEYLQQFDMKIEHRLGRLHANADGLSRRPWPEDPLVDKLEETNLASAPLIVETTTHVDETEQSQDKHLRAVREWLEAGRRPPKQEMEGDNRHMWSLWSQYNRMLLKDELLYRRWFDEKTGRENLQLCVPQHLKGDLLQELHDECGHLSVRKTTDNVRKQFYWFGHTVDIELYCQTCRTCGSRNGPTPRSRAPMQSIRTGYPLERIQTDILGPLPETNMGNKFVAVVVDMYTKWPEAYALPDQEAETVAHAVMDNFICRFGCPRGVLSDQGRNFESLTFRGLCSLIESIKQRTTPYHPQCDGGAERLIRTVTNIIAKIAEEQKQWDQHLPKVLLALRASTHETTGFSPIRAKYMFSLLTYEDTCELAIQQMKVSGKPLLEQAISNINIVTKKLKTVNDINRKNKGNDDHDETIALKMFMIQRSTVLYDYYDHPGEEELRNIFGRRNGPMRLIIQDQDSESSKEEDICNEKN